VVVELHCQLGWGELKGQAEGWMLEWVKLSEKVKEEEGYGSLK
jgi:hypothetical protein